MTACNDARPDETADSMSLDEFLAECAKTCRNCPNCGNPPCGACQAGGVCDEMDCYCGDAMHDDEDDSE